MRNTICQTARNHPTIAPLEKIYRTAFHEWEDNRISLHRPHGTPISGVSYAFDHVVDETCSNAQVYELLTRDLIHAAVEGFNGTAFAYGQTSSGKTFTMNSSANDLGIIHRAVEDIFEKIQAVSIKFLIRVSYMEIYNEEINDLLSLENQKLQIHESLERGIFVAGLKEEIVNNAEQVLQLKESGEVNRHFGGKFQLYDYLALKEDSDIFSQHNRGVNSLFISILHLIFLAECFY
ncbi:hypothetical protein SLA2020_159740 [Shorea laevis]